MMCFDGPCSRFAVRSTNLPAEADLLKRVTVRLIDPHEREEFDRRLEADHYLGRCALYGPSLRYVAELDGQYVALYLKARDLLRGLTKPASSSSGENHLRFHAKVRAHEVSRNRLDGARK